MHKKRHLSFKAIILVEKVFCCLKGGIWTRSVVKCSCLNYKLVLAWLRRLLNTGENQKLLIIQNNSFFSGQYNETLTAVNGTFESPNCPRNYSDGKYCFWRIAVTTAQQLYLKFSSFSLQNENSTDALYVYDGENAKGEVLKVFNGGHPPPKEGICISSNRIFVVFKSDNAESFHSFSASYYGVSNSGECLRTLAGSF